jgi:dihydroneopterin aldolase
VTPGPVAPTIVKVGGSFCRFPRLAEMVAALEAGAGRTIVVPGGGPFADCVRAEQKRVGFDDATAHRMALLAMAQFGFVLASFSPVLVPARGPEEVGKALADGKVPIWLPLQLIEGHPDVPETWDMTSDSLAAWLAGRLGARRLLFVKRVSTPRSMKAADLVAEGILDPLAPAFLAGSGVEAWLCGTRHLQALGPALAADAPVGCRIDLA